MRFVSKDTTATLNHSGWAFCMSAPGRESAAPDRDTNRHPRPPWLVEHPTHHHTHAGIASRAKGGPPTYLDLDMDGVTVDERHAADTDTED